MQTKTNPSVNIIRDIDGRMLYVPTSNAQNTVDTIIYNFNSGFHSNVIIGSYGTGKSSLIWAFEKTLKGEPYFKIDGLKYKKNKIDFIRFVGEYESIINKFSETLNIKKLSAGNQQIFDAIYQRYEPLKKDGLLVLLVDELGKFLEYAVKNNAERELYFIQQLAEFINHPDRNILFVSTLHQNFDAYGLELNEKQKNEWRKVSGRLKEITFNEPIEQLLQLASDYIEGRPEIKLQAKINQIYEAVQKFKIFSVKKSFISNIGNKIYPLDFITGYCLTLSLQRYGQNERSLFSFLKSREFQAVHDKNSFFDIVWLYDYLWGNLYSFLKDRSNPDFQQWRDIADSIERAEAILTKGEHQAINIIKTIGILNIFASKGATINTDFLNTYFKTVCDISGSDEILGELEKYKIVKYSKFRGSYQLFQGTDVDIEHELKKAEKTIDEISDVTSYLNKHFGQLPLITAKEITYTKGTPRVFQFSVSESLKYLVAANEIDGYINLIVNEGLDEGTLAEHSEADNEANVYGLFKNSDKIKSYLVDIEKAQKVKANNDSDKIVRREMDVIINSTKNLLKHYFIDAIYTDNVVWYYRGKKQKIGNKAQFNKLLSQVCKNIYTYTPEFRNELINRHKISSSIHSSRKDFFANLVNKWQEKDLGYDDRFPADKTIYISLLKENKIHFDNNGIYTLSTPDSSSSFKPIWEACEQFLETAKEEPKAISELYALLSQRPYKLKLGLLELWVPIFLFVKKDDFALFSENRYVPEFNETTLLRLVRNPEDFTLKSFNIQGVRLDLFNKYRELLSQTESSKPGNNSFVESIKPFVVFYNQLPEYTKNTRKGLSKEALELREAIVKAVDLEKTFFEDFPRALNTSIAELNQSKENLQEYANKLRSSITELRTAYEGLIDRFESYLCKNITGTEVDFEVYKLSLQSRFKRVKTYMLLNHHKAFLQRLNSPIDDKKIWLSSLVQVLIGKSLDTVKDEDIDILFSKLKTIVHELDNFIELASEKSDESKERVFKFELTSDKTVSKTIVKIPKTKFDELEKAEKQIKAILKQDDRQLNIAILTKLLQEQLNNDKN